MNANRQEGCAEEHVTGATEFHSDGRLCGEWLSGQERSRLSPDQCSLTMEMVMRDQFDNWGTHDRGQLLRLQKSPLVGAASKAAHQGDRDISHAPGIQDRI